MTKKEIEAACISVCRYYKGEAENPYKDGGKDSKRHWFWEYERFWVKLSVSSTEDDNGLGYFIDEYNRNGMYDFEPYDGVPLTLKAFLFVKLSNELEGMVNKEIFKKWYVSYKGSAE